MRRVLFALVCAVLVASGFAMPIGAQPAPEVRIELPAIGVEIPATRLDLTALSVRPDASCQVPKTGLLSGEAYCRWARAQGYYCWALILLGCDCEEPPPPIPPGFSSF